MKYGADPEIEDANGLEATTLSLHVGPHVSAVLEKWKRKRSGAGPTLRKNKSCDGCKERQSTLKVCSRCKVALYCNTTCQSTPLPQLFDGKILTDNRRSTLADA
jgi:MYND finger